MIKTMVVDGDTEADRAQIKQARDNSTAKHSRGRSSSAKERRGNGGGGASCRNANLAGTCTEDEEADGLIKANSGASQQTRSTLFSRQRGSERYV